MLCRRWRVATRLVRESSGGAGPVESPLKRLVRGAMAGGEARPLAPALQWATQPYAAPLAPRPPPPARSPAPRTVLLFPGQGAQWVGMGRGAADHPAARALYDTASDVLGWDVYGVCTGGPAPELQRRAQVGVLVTALAALERAREERPGTLQAARAAAGFSAGEIAALTWAGAIGLEDALRFAELRAAAMAAASKQRPGGMLTVWLAPAAPLGRACVKAAQETGGVCSVAVYLYPGCRVVAGDEKALQWLEREGKNYGVKRAARIAVAGAYHCAVMAPTREPVAQALRCLNLHAPRATVWSCTYSRRYTDARSVARGLTRLAWAPVRWEQTLQALFAVSSTEAPPHALALGPAKGLAHALRRVNARAADNCLLIDI